MTEYPTIVEYDARLGELRRRIDELRLGRFDSVTVILTGGLRATGHQPQLATMVGELLPDKRGETTPDTHIFVMGDPARPEFSYPLPVGWIGSIDPT